MLISIETHLSYTARQPCDVLLQIEAASDEAQYCQEASLTLKEDHGQHEIWGEEGIGTRRWVKAEGAFECQYKALVDVTRAPTPLADLPATAVWKIPSDVTKFLLPSRYCHPDRFFEFVPVEFPNLTGGALIAALSDWITANFRYDNSISDSNTAAFDSFDARAGVCRDYAHVLIAMARAAAIPARFVSAYGPDVSPQDIHAVVEVYLNGRWHLVDPTGMAEAAEIVRIGVGRDAADAAFMTSYGWMELKKQAVKVVRLD